MNEIGQPSPEEIQKAAEELKKPFSNEEKQKARILTPAQMFALANHLEKQGHSELPAEMRANAHLQQQKQPQVPEAYPGEAFQKKIDAENKARLEEIARQPKVPRHPHNPRFDTMIAGSETQKRIDNIINQAGQTKSQSALNAPEGSTPTGGK